MENKNKPRRIIGNRRPEANNYNSDNRVSESNSYQEKIKRSKNYYNSPKKYERSKKVRPVRTREERVRRGVNERRERDTGEAVVTKPSYKWLKKLALILLVFFILLALIVYAYAKLAPLNPDLSGNISLYNISRDAAVVASSHRVANVAIFGIDGREDVEGDRSDAIMIGSADFEHNKLKVTSLMRDTFVKIADSGEFDKLNAAYTYGGPMGALRTINLNFDTAITDYIVFDFTALVAVVNAVGGVDINVSDEEELYWINQYLMDVNDKVKTADPPVAGVGPQHLTGSQALAYARIRYTGNGDYDRTQRQRNVLEQVVARVSQMPPTSQIAVLRSVLPYVETSLRMPEFINYGLNFLLMSDRGILQDRLPQDGMAEDGYLDGVSYIFPATLDDNIKAWYRFVYDIDYQPSETANEISEEISEIW